MRERIIPIIVNYPDFSKSCGHDAKVIAPVLDLLHQFEWEEFYEFYKKNGSTNNAVINDDAIDYQFTITNRFDKYILIKWIPN